MGKLLMLPFPLPLQHLFILLTSPTTITLSHCPCTITLHTITLDTIPQTSHWVTIFAALGEDYAHFHPYTLTDFALYNIYEHSDIIFEICHDAMQEEKLRIQVGLRQFSEMRKNPWENLVWVSKPKPSEC